MHFKSLLTFNFLIKYVVYQTKRGFLIRKRVFQIEMEFEILKVFWGEGKTNLRSISNPAPARFRFLLYFSVAEAKVNPGNRQKKTRIL